MTRYALILATLASLACEAAEGQAPADAGPPADWFAQHGKGKLEYRLFWHTGGRPQDSRKVRQEARLGLEIDFPLSQTTRLFLAPDLRWDTRHMAAGTLDELNRDEVRRPIFHFKEAYLDWHSGPWDLRVGEQIFAWGTADGFNPTDNLNPRDYLDLVDNEKIPVFALSATYHVAEATSLQFVLLPFFTPSRFDGQHSRWSFFPADPDLGFERDLPSDSLAHMQFGLRAKTSLGGWDLSLSYFDGYNDIGRPSLLFQPLLTPDGPTLVPDAVHFDFDKVRILGADFATAWRNIGFHGELAHTWTESRHDDSYLQYVVGIDHTWADIRPGQNLRLVLEYAGEAVTRRGRRLDGLPPSKLGRCFDGSILAKAIYEISDKAKLELKAAANLRGDNNFYFQPAFVFDLNSDLRLKLGADIFMGDRRTFFGQFERNTRFFLTLEYTF